MKTWTLEELAALEEPEVLEGPEVLEELAALEGPEVGGSDEFLDPPLSEPDPTLAGADEPEQTIEDLLRLSETAVAGAYDPEETVEDLLRRHAQRAAEEHREEGEQRTAEYVEQHKQALGGSRKKRSISLEELAVGGYKEYPEPAPSEPGTPEFSKWLVEKQIWDRHQRQKGKTIVQREKNYAKWYQEAIERSEKGDFDIKTPEYVIKKTPFVGTVAEGVEVYEFIQSAEKIKNKTAEARDFNVVVSMLRRQENEADSSWLDAVGDTIASLPGFAVEFGLTGGTGTAGRVLASRYLRKVLGKYAKKKAAQVAIKGAAIATGVGARTAAMPQQVFAATAQKMTPEVDRGAILSGDADHALSAIDNTTSKDFGTALLKGLGSTYTEVLTESVGPVLNKVFAKIGAGTGASRIKKAVTDHLLGERKLTPDRLKGIYAKGGWDGLFAEFGEERLGELIRGLTGIEDDYGATGDVLSGDPERIKQGLYDMSVEGGAFFAPTAVRSTRHLFRPMAGERAFNTESEEAQEFIANPSRTNAKKLGVHELAPSAKERKKLAEEMEAWEGFKKGMGDVATSPQEADSAIQITEARARALGESPGSFVKRRIRGVEKHDSYEEYMKSVRQDQTGPPPLPEDPPGGPPPLPGGPPPLPEGLKPGVDQNLRRWAETDNVVTDASPNSKELGAPHTGGKMKTGKPVAVQGYHGSPAAGFTEFSEKLRGSFTGAPSATQGYFFSGTPKTAEGYSGLDLNEESIPHVGYLRLPSHLKIDVLKKVTHRAGLAKGVETQQIKSDDIRQFSLEHPEVVRDIAYDTLHKAGDYETEYDTNLLSPGTYKTWVKFKNPLVVDLHGDSYNEATYNAAIADAKAEGHDGIILKNTYDPGGYAMFRVDKNKRQTDNVFVVFNNTQIKSATGNRGTYDETSDINAQEADFRSGVGLLPSGPKRVRGHIQMHEDGTNTIRVFADAQDASTLIHELGHLFIQDLGPKDIGTVGRWAGAKKNKDDQWVFSREAHEKWARGFERYLRDGKAPSKRLKRAFKNFKKWLTEIYGVIKGSPIDVEISPQIRDVFDRMLTETVESDLQRDLTSAGADEPGEQTPSSGAGGLGVITPATEGVGENIIKAGRKTMVALRRAFASKGLKTEHMDDTITGRDGFILKHATAIQQNTAELKKAYRRLNGRRAEITPKEAERFNRALQDPEVMKEMPSELAVPLTEMRDHVDTLSRRLYELVGEDSDLGSAIEERFGKYLTRTYKKFTDPGWVDKALADTQIMADFAAEVRGHAPKATKAEIRTLAEQMLRRDTRSLKSVSSGVQGYVNVMKKRKVDSPAIRALYGEHKDVFINYRQTVSNIAKLVANKEAMADILEVGLKTGIMSTDQSHGHTHEVNHKKLPQLEIFEGVFMDETTAQALEDVYDEFTRVGGILGDIQRSYLGLSLAGKAALTVGSWTATVRNLFSGVGQALSNGGVGTKNMEKAAEIVWWDGVKGALSTEATSKKDRETKQRLVELRVIEDVAYDELKGIGKEIARGESYPGVQITDNMEVGGWGRAKLAIPAGRAVAKGAGKVYQSMDAVRRVATFLQFMEDYREAFPEMSKKELEEFCAKRLRDLDPTYSRASKAAKLWSRYFPWGPFSMFHAEQIRTNANRVKIIREEIFSDNAVLRKLGRRKFIGTAAWLALPSLAAKSWHAFIGLSPEEEEELRERTAFSANSDVVFLSWNRETGKYKYLDLSYSDPFGVLKRTIWGGLRKGVAEAAGEFLSPFTGEDIAAKALKELYDGDVADEGVDEYTQIKQIAEHLRDLVTPQTIKAWKKIQGISPGKRAPEIVATITGFRVSEGNIDRTDGFATRKFVRTMRASGDDVTKKLKYGDIEDLVQYYESAERKRKKTFNEWVDYVGGSSVLGVPKSATTLDNHLNNRHKKLVRQVIADSYVPFRPSPTTMNWLKKGKKDADKYDKHKWEARITAGELIIQMAKEADSDSTTKP